MLTRIFGLHGCGKSSIIYEKLEECIQQKKQAFLLVPEQQAVSAERRLIDTLGNPANMYVEVINFKRLCNRVFRESGGVSAAVPDATAGHLAMAHVLWSLSDSLKEYGALAGDAEFALKMLSTVNKMHMGRVGIGMLEEILPEIKKNGHENLYNKISDLILAGKGYEAYTEQVLEFPGDLLDKLYETLCSYDFFKGKSVFIDSFYGFTAQELAIIEKMLSTADDVYISFLCENEKQEDKCFARGTDAALKTRKLAEKQGVGIKDIYLTENVKHKASPALKKTAESFSLSAFSAKTESEAQKKFDDKDGVEIFSCENIYKEARFAAETVSALLLDGVKPREIAICAKDTASYDGILDSSFESAGIPFSFDKHTDLSATPVAALVTAAFEIYFSWSLQSVISYIKTGLSGLTDKEADELEMYMRTWNINGKAYFHEVWYMNPEGITESEPDAAKLERIEASKDVLLSALDGFCDSLDNAVTASDIARAAYTLTVDIAKSKGKKVFDDGADGVYLDLLYRILDSVAETIGNEQMTPRRFYELYRSAIKNMSAGKIPELIDQVRFSPVSLMRTDGIRYVIILGVNDGIFPGASESSQIFKETELRLLRNLGVDMGESGEDMAYDEIFLAYTALCSASEKAYVTYRNETVSGDTMYPSVIINILKTLLGINEKVYTGNSAVESALSDEALFDTYLTMQDGVEKATVRAYFMQKPEFKDRIYSAERRDGSFYPLSDEVLSELYGDDFLTSYSKLEKYRSCPFMYFCSYTLKLKTPPVAELGAIEVGNTVHKVLEELIPEMTRLVAEEKLEGAEIRKLVKSKLDEMLTRILPGKGKALTKNLEYLLARLEGRITALCNELATELKFSKFIPADFELSISPDSDVKPARIPLENGKTLSIVGQIDRVDLFEDKQTGQTWVRITDYKTGSKEFKLTDVKSGFNLQMLLYLYTLTAGETEKYGKLYPAGLMYRIVKTPSEKTSFDKASADDFYEPDTTGEISGIAVTEPEIVFAMDSSGTGRFVPVKLNGKDERAMSLDSLTELLKESVDIAAKLAVEISSGNKKAKPFTENAKDPCGYCEYAPMCIGYIPGKRGF